MKNLRKARKQSLKSIVQAGRDGGSDSVEINDPSGRQLIYIDLAKKIITVKK